MRLKKTYLTLFLLILSMILVACGGDTGDDTPTEAPATASESDPTAQPDPTDPPPTIAPEADGSIWVLLPDSASSARWETDDRRFFEQAFDAAGVEYNIVNAEGDARTQQTQAEQAITSGAKVILMVNLDSGSGAAIIAAAREADVKVIDYDRLTIEGEGADVYVSFDNVQVGKTMGDVLESLIDAQDDPKVVLLNGGPTDNNATLFREGYLSVAQPYFDSEEWAWVDDQAVDGWDNQTALVVMEQILTAADNEVTAVFAANDGLAGATISALKNAGLDPQDIPISGQDATVGGLQNIIAGDQAMTVYKPIKAEAEAAAAAAIALLNGDDVTELTGGLTLNNGTSDVPFLALEPIGVTKEKIAGTVIADGFRTWEEICVGDFEALCTDNLKAGKADSGLAGAGADLEGSIWVLLPDSASSARWETDDRRFFEAAFEEAGVEYNIVNAEGDARTQQTQAEQAITSGASVILMVNLDSGSGAAIIAAAREADVKVIDYDRLTIEGEGADVYVSFDNVQVGKTMGDVLEPLIDAQDEPKVVLLNGGPTDNNATLFREGYLSVAQPYFDDESWAWVDDQAVDGWDNQTALVVMEQILTAADNEVTAVFAANDGLAGATISALKNAGLDPQDIPISGQDATVGGLQNILAGDQAMTVYKPIKAEAEAAARAAIALLKGEDLDSLTGGLTLNNGTSDVPFLALEPVGVTKDKIASTVIADGFRTWEEICVGDFADFCTDAVKNGEVEEMGGLAGSGEGLDGSIWVLLPDSASSARWETDDRRFFEAAFEEAGVEYNIVNAEGDARTQQTQAEQAITSGAAVILMVNLDSGSGAAIIASAREAGVKVIDYDRLTIEGEGADVYVSFDNVQVGKTMGDVLEPLIDAQDDPKVVLLNGGPTDNNATLFRQGYLGVAQSYFDSEAWTLVDDQAVDGWDNQTALVVMEQILTAADNEVTAVFAANDGLAGATISALKNAGLDPQDIPISGQDATVGGLQNIIAGDQSMTVYKPIKAEAEAAARAAIALLKGEDLDSLTGGLTLNNGTNDVPFIALEPIGVTKDKIASTVIADGFRTWDEICVGDFNDFCTDDVKAGNMDEGMMDDGGDAVDYMAMMPDASGADGSVWVLLPDSASSARWETDDRRFFEQAFDAAGVDYNIVNAEGDARTQQTQAEQAITSGAKVILMVNLDSGSGAAIIAAAREADVAIIDYDRLTIEGDGADVYVSFDNVQVGKTMGDVLEPLIDAQDDPQVVLLNGGPTDNNATLFRQGYLSVAQPYFDSEAWTWVDDQSVDGWDNQTALVVMEQILTAADNEVTAVFAANDGLAGATISALLNAGLDPLEIPVSGQDATVGGIQNILAGNQSMTVYKPIKAEAEAAAVAAVKLLLGESLDELTGGLTLDNGTSDVPFVALTPIGVTADNVAETVIADGFRTWDEICVGDFDQYCPADR